MGGGGADKSHPRREAEPIDQLLELTPGRTVAEDGHRWRMLHPGNGLDQEVQAFLGGEPRDRHDTATPRGAPEPGGVHRHRLHLLRRDVLTRHAGDGTGHGRRDRGDDGGAPEHTAAEARSEGPVLEEPGVTAVQGQDHRELRWRGQARREPPMGVHHDRLPAGGGLRPSAPSERAPEAEERQQPLGTADRVRQAAGVGQGFQGGRCVSDATHRHAIKHRCPASAAVGRGHDADIHAVGAQRQRQGVEKSPREVAQAAGIVVGQEDDPHRVIPGRVGRVAGSAGRTPAALHAVRPGVRQRTRSRRARSR